MIYKIENGVLLRCRIQPGAKRNGIVGRYGEESIKISLNAPPVDGKANEALRKFLSKLCGISLSQVNIKSGHTSRNKSVVITGVELEKIEKILLENEL